MTHSLNLARSATDHLKKQSYHEMKCFNIAEKMQYQNSTRRIQREEASPFVQLWVVVMELTSNAGVVIQACWLWVSRVINSQLAVVKVVVKNCNVAIAFAILVASSLRIVVMIILELAPGFTM